MWMQRIRFLLLPLFFSLSGYGAISSSSCCFSRGYTVIPAPQKVRLGTNDLEFTRAWRLELGPGSNRTTSPFKA